MLKINQSFGKRVWSKFENMQKAKGKEQLIKKVNQTSAENNDASVYNKLQELDYVDIDRHAEIADD